MIFAGPAERFFVRAGYISMLPAIVLAALIASGMLLSKRDAVSAAQEASTDNKAKLNPYADPGMIAASRLMEAKAGKAATRDLDSRPPGTVWSPLRGMNVPVEDMKLDLQPFYRGAAPGPLIDREKAAPPEPKREVVETRGWNPDPRGTMEQTLNMATYKIASNLSATRQGELLMQPIREQKPLPESVPRVLPPNIDVLRSQSKPRLVDKGRIIPGSSVVSNRTSTPNVAKRTADGFKINTAADLLPSSAPAEASYVEPEQILHPTTRGIGPSNYLAHASGSSLWTGDGGQMTDVPRNVLPSPPVGPAGKTGGWDFRNDMSANQYADTLRNNERDVLVGNQVAFPLIGMRAAAGNGTYVTPQQERSDWNFKTFTTAAPRIYGNIRGATALKQTMYDPNMVARTTLKETMIHDTTVGIAGPRADRVTARNNDIPDPTIRNTLESVDSNANLAPPIVKPQVYDPYDIPNPTHRDTVGDATYPGNVDTTPQGQAYATVEYDARNTQRQFLGNTEYSGIADRENGDGYQVTDADARNTQRQFLGDSGVEYGPAGSVNFKKSMSYADIYAARIKGIKETILARRSPTPVGTKLFMGSQDPNLSNAECRRDPYLEHADRPTGFVSRQGAVQQMSQPDCRQDTKRVNAVPLCNVRQDGVTEIVALRDNPYTLDIRRGPSQKMIAEELGDMGTVIQLDQAEFLRQGLPQRMCEDRGEGCLVVRPDERPDICRQN